MSDDFPADVKRFIDQNIESLPQLEALLLLRQDSQRQWDAGEVAKALYIPPELADSLLADLNKGGFVQVAPLPDLRYAYGPADAEIDQLIKQVAAVYRERRVAVITLIYSKPLNKVQTFADAFRLRKEN